jgi:hypothetical protein
MRGGKCWMEKELTGARTEIVDVLSLAMFCGKKEVMGEKAVP